MADKQPKRPNNNAKALESWESGKVRAALLRRTTDQLKGNVAAKHAMPKRR